MKIDSSALILLGIFSTSASIANTLDSNSSCVTTPQDYLVFSETSIRALNGDFQGLTGAETNVTFQDFEVRPNGSTPALVAGGRIALNRVGIENGNVETPVTALINNSHINGKLIQSKDPIKAPELGELPSVARFYREKSADLSLKTPNSTVTPYYSGFVLNSTSSDSAKVYSLTAAQLNSATSITLAGASPWDTIIINVSGDNIHMANVGMDVGGLSPRQIVFNFYQATSLVITASGSANFGIPGTILAPHATSLFSEMRVTGGVYVHSLNVSGRGNFQVNYADRPWSFPHCAY